MEPFFVEFSPDSRTGLKGQAQAAVSDALRGRTKHLAIGLDRLSTFDDAAIAATIVALRRLREVGGTVSLVTRRGDHRARIAATGLDRVFDVRAGDERTDVRPATRRARRFPHLSFGRIGRALFAVVLCAGTTLGPVSAQEDATIAIDDEGARMTVARLIEHDPNLQTFEADVHVDIAMRSFPWLHPKLEGKTYFKRPDRYEVVFTRLPSYAKGLNHLYADIGDPSTWSRKFIIRADGERTVGGRRQLALRMVQRVRGMIEYEEVYVNPDTWTVDELDYRYYNGGSIAVEQTFAPIGGFTLLQSQRATIAIPHVRAVATSTFDRFQTNVAIDDTVFVKNAQAQQ